MALGPEVDGDWKLSSGSPSAGLALSSRGNDEAKSDELDGEYERDDNDPVALETEGNQEEDDSSFDDESPRLMMHRLMIGPITWEAISLTPSDLIGWIIPFPCFVFLK